PPWVQIPPSPPSEESGYRWSRYSDFFTGRRGFSVSPLHRSVIRSAGWRSFPKRPFPEVLEAGLPREVPYAAVPAKTAALDSLRLELDGETPPWITIG